MAIKIKNLGFLFSMRIEEDGIGIISTNGGIYVSDPITNKLLIDLNNNKNIKNIIFDFLKFYNVDYDTLVRDIKNILKKLKNLNFTSKDIYIKVLEDIDEI